MQTEKEEGAPLPGGPVDRSVRCFWPWSHQWTKWDDIAGANNKLGHPIIIQERRCTCCGMAQRHIVTCSA